MAIPVNKAQLLAAMRQNYLLLKKELETISQVRTNERSMPGHAKGTEMSVCNLLAYLNGWGQLVLKWVKHTGEGRPVDFPETGYKWSELGELAQKFYRDHEADSYIKLNEKLDKTFDALLKLVASKTDRQLYRQAFYGQWPLGRLIQLNTASPYKNATIRLRKWKKNGATPK